MIGSTNKGAPEATFFPFRTLPLGGTALMPVIFV
jgi:hypothetical protein